MEIKEPSKYRRSTSIDQIDPQILKLLVKPIDDIAFKQISQELKQTLGLPEIDDKSQTYKDFRHYLQVLLEYPSRSLAELHRASHRLGNFDRYKTNDQKQLASVSYIQGMIINLQNCPCCGLVRQQQQINICSYSMNDIVDVGISTYMFFRTIKNLIWLMLFAFLVFGVFAFASNIKCADRWNREPREFDFDNILRISLNPKIFLAVDQKNDYDDLLVCQIWLGFVLVIFQMGGYILMEHVKQTNTREVEDLKKSASNYSIVLKNVPADITKQQVQKQINTLMGYNRDTSRQFKNPYQIFKINVPVPLSISSSAQQNEKHQLLQLQEKNINYRQQIGSWIKQVCTKGQFSTPVQTRKQTQQQYLQNKQKIIQKHKTISQHIKTLYKTKRNKNLTDCYVTFQSIVGKDQVLHSVQETACMKFLRYLTVNIYQKQFVMSFGRENQEYKVMILQASQPEDIVWINAGVNATKRFIRKFITFFIAFVVLGMSFAAVYGISNIQVAHNSNRYVSFLISLSIVIFNYIISVVLKIVTMYEFNGTQTQSESSYAIKVIFAKLINTILIPIVVSRFLKKAVYLHTASDLSSDIFYLSLSLSFIIPLFKIISPYYIFTQYILVWYYDRPEKKFFMNQKQLNRLYELVLYESGQEYIYVVSLYLWVCFFMSLQPIIILFGIAGCLINYWNQKYCLFHKSKRPVPGNTILYGRMIHFVYAGGLFYALGSLTFVNLLPEDLLFAKSLKFALIPNLLAVCLSGISLFVPYSYFYSQLFPKKTRQIQQAVERPATKKHGQVTLKRQESGRQSSWSQKTQLYSKNRLFFASQYDRTNPATAQQAINDYLKLVYQIQQQIKNNLISQPEIEVIFQNLQNQARSYYRQPLNQLNGLNYFSSIAGAQINEFYNPQVNDLHPNMIQNFLLEGMAEGNQIRQGELGREGNQMKRKQTVLEKVRNFLTVSGNNRQIDNNVQLQMSQQRLADYDNHEFTEQNVNKMNQEKGFDKNRIQNMGKIVNPHLSRIQRSRISPMAQYSRISPYNPVAQQKFNKISNDMMREDILQANTKGFFLKVNEFIETDQNQIRK